MFHSIINLFIKKWEIYGKRTISKDRLVCKTKKGIFAHDVRQGRANYDKSIRSEDFEKIRVVTFIGL